ncbi:hypothetical protein yc1106_08162 [Curvularia clavata]|uniref:WD40 repeat-like protein n=1 Tax=Curvularia clavata TaxID=95742 RepID=A0A9Q9DUD8_CURCL|nr:hypothetical protein yc1106_08162 [Curvularia clavata]
MSSIPPTRHNPSQMFNSAFGTTRVKNDTSNMRSDWQQSPVVIDLTDDADETNSETPCQLLSLAANRSTSPDAPLLPTPPIVALQLRNTYYPPLLKQHAGRSCTKPTIGQEIQTPHEGFRPLIPTPASTNKKTHYNLLPKSYIPPPAHAYHDHTYNAPYEVGREAKRPRIDPKELPSPPMRIPTRQREAATFLPPRDANYLAGPIEEPRDDDKDSVLSGILPPDSHSPQKPTASAVVDHTIIVSTQTHAVASTTTSTMPPTESTGPPSKRRRAVQNPFNTAQDHLLIFLKEVKKYKWSDITVEYNKDMPHRTYSALQGRYAQTLSKRDRSQDPPTLVLPTRFAAEASIDWSQTHGNERLPPRLPLALPTTEHDYSSGTDSRPSRGRPRRAQRVNYTWPKPRSWARGVAAGEQNEEQELGDMLDDASSTDSETPEEDLFVPDVAVAVDNDPIEVNFDAEDAKMGMQLRSKTRSTLTGMIPYLSMLERTSLRNPEGCCWDQLSSRKWQGSRLHVDFSPTEVNVVKTMIVSTKRSLRSRHGTQRRELRELLKGFTEPEILKLVEALRRRLPCRDSSSIKAFLEDAQKGHVSKTPHIQRLAAARPDISMSTMQKPSTTSVIRQRELGCQSRRGWRTAPKPLTYQVKNQIMDTIGPSATWIGASSDIHTVAWASDGERFAAGAVAVDDPDSMQYNRPNNLLFGNMMHGSIRELAEHYKNREKTETGANSSHAMFASQDPKLYTTVSSVAFSTSGNCMYSAGYDKHIGIWFTATGSMQPVLGAKLNVNDPIDILSVNHSHTGVLATAARVARKSIRVLRIDEEDPSRFDKLSLHSDKAVSRLDLNILPSALRFEPKFGALLLAGFGANLKETGFDTTGDLCLWDIQAESPLTIYGSNKNIFDVAFNPNRSSMPAFAAGCVAGANVNKGMRSVIRLYDLNTLGKFTCPVEFECKALDINDVVWCPHDEHLLAAGCTDGRTYVWDIRRPNDPLRVVSHGRSLMPLQDGVKHELTDTGVRFLSWGENATRLYSGSSDGVIKVWDVTKANEDTYIKDLITTDSGIMAGAFSADYSKLIVGEVNGAVNVLEVGKNDISLKDAEKLRYFSYQDGEHDEALEDKNVDNTEPGTESGIAEARHLLGTGQMQFQSMGSFPIRQAVQGPRYRGPFDEGVDAPFLRQQALEFQLDLAKEHGPQCEIVACKANVNKTTSEDVGDSGRSADRIPDELRRQWKAIDATHIIPGKSRCTHCGRPARPIIESASNVLCERCSFACFHCGSSNPIAPETTTLICDFCAGVWDIGVLGYECIQQPIGKRVALDVPPLKWWGKEVYAERLEASDTDFGDEMNALTEYYYSLTIDRPESPSR